MNKTKAFLLELIHDITTELSIPLIFCLFIELFSNLQILSLSLLPLLHNVPTSSNKLSSALNHTLSYLEPFKILDPFYSEASVIAILALCCLYFGSYILIIGYVALHKGEKFRFKKELCKTASFVTMIHSKIIFYLIHCFVMKAMNSHKDFCSDASSFGCMFQRIILPVILLIVNTLITLMQELFCYQIHQYKLAYGIKTNLHNFIKFSHKYLVIMLLYFLEDSSIKILIPFNVAFTVLDLAILDSRLPFYNMKMLKLSIACSTISAACAIFSSSKFFRDGENLCLIMILAMPLIVKISLMKLNTRLLKIFSFKSLKNPFHMVQLPSLIEEYLDKNTIFPLPKKLSNATLYSMGFMSSSQIENINLSIKEGNMQDGTKETHKAVYSAALEGMEKMMQKYPRNELLSLCVAQIYYLELEDSFKALDITNRISDKHKTFAGRISLQSISRELAKFSQRMNQISSQEKQKNSHLNYFAYRNKAQILKRRIKIEIDDHIKLWKSFNDKELDVLNMVSQASKISPHTRSIMDYWKRNFEGYEVLNVNASLMYGLYLEIVQAIPYGSHTYFKKAYSSINNKWHIYKDIIDVVTGQSGIIVASVEPDKIGKIIDTSSSVKTLFKTSEHGLIGSNIAVVLPNIVAVKHNDLIKGYQKYFTGNINHNINSYAKTLQDEYFKAEVTLHVSPLIHKGVNLVGFIKKVSDYQSLMIVDPQGNVMECSKDLGISLNLNNIRRIATTKIEQLCPDFKRINQAFSIIYKTNDDEVKEGGIMPDDTIQSPKSCENSMLPLVPPSDQRHLLLSSSITTREIESPYQGSRRNRRTLSSMFKTIIEAHIERKSMTLEEAQEVWESFKNNQQIYTFYPNDNSSEELRYKAEIEPFFFDRKWYQIIKLKATSQNHNDNKPVTSIAMTPIVNILDNFADTFPNEDERTEDDKNKGSAEQQSQDLLFIRKNERFMSTQLVSAGTKHSDSNNMFEESTNDPVKKVKLNKTRSVVTSQASQEMTAQKLNDSLKIEKLSPSSRLVITLVYFAVIAIICSISTHLMYTTDSLNEMQSSINIIKTVNTRLAKTIFSWQATVVLYSRSVRLRPIDFRIPVYQKVSIDASMAVLKNAKELTEQADKLQKKHIVEALYAKTVSLWEPLDGTLFNDKAIDQFSANQVLLSYYLSTARYKGSYYDLNGSREFLFAINNTANDYLLTLEKSVDDLSDFFEKTKDTNILVLILITIVEILSVLSPLILILVILVIVVKTYKKFFQAICKINDQSLSLRVAQLENISKLFENHLEDDISSFQNFKLQARLSIKAASKKATSVNYSRTFQLRNLTIYLLRYISIAAILVMIIITLIAISLSKSIKGLENLDSINKKALTIYQTGAQIRMIPTTFFMDIIFYNNTNYKIRNNDPSDELTKQLKILDNVNNIFLSTFKDGEKNTISDPVIQDVLNGNVCNYVTAQYQPNCLIGTKGGSYGLLGLNAFYTQVCGVIKDWVNAGSKTFALGSTMSALYSNKNNNTHFAIFDAYDYLTNYLVDNFIEETEENKNQMQEMFYQNIGVVLVSMILIRVFVIKKLQVFDLGIRRILRIIPYKIIEENKGIAGYLARNFEDELKVLKQLG